MPIVADAVATSCKTLNKLSLDPRRINDVNFVAVYGKPANGKSSFASRLAKTGEFISVHADFIFDKDVFTQIENGLTFLSYPGEPDRQHFNIAKYVDSDLFDEDLFIDLLTDELKYRLQKAQSAHTVLLDGYVFKYYERIFSKLSLSEERTLVLEATRVNDRYMIEDFDVTGFQYDRVLEHIRQNFRSKCSDSTIPRSKYQNFYTLGVDTNENKFTDSDSAIKYEASHIDDVVDSMHKVIDIGCNAGYFCFRIAKKTRSMIVGVDATRHWLEIASHINNSIFLHNNILFIKEEATKFLFENAESFNVVHCSSTYHYFRDRQVYFLQSAHYALSPAGMLVLEVELAEGGGEPEVTMRSRGVDSTPCAFPNRAMFLNQIRGLFQVEAEFPSAFQRGSFYPRTYFHLRRV